MGRVQQGHQWWRHARQLEVPSSEVRLFHPKNLDWKLVIFWSSLIWTQQMPDLLSKWLPQTYIADDNNRHWCSIMGTALSAMVCNYKTKTFIGEINWTKIGYVEISSALYIFKAVLALTRFTLTALIHVFLYS